MQIQVTDPLSQTVLFSLILGIVLILSIKKDRSSEFFSKDVTNELKGLAILAIVLSHIGYFLSSDNRFLYPLSVLAGVGVNLFLILSGFGLTISQIHRPLSWWRFYKKRLVKLFVPLWVAVGVIFGMDYFLLNRNYPMNELASSLIGFFPRADLWQNVDSPLWYFTLILFFYLIYPILFIKKYPWLTPLLILGLSLMVLNLPLPVDPDVVKLYNQHFLAFPLGVLLALLFQKLKFRLNTLTKVIMMAMALVIFADTAINSGVGRDPMIEQSVSLITAISLLVIFSLSRINFRLFSLLGIFSYEIYLLHWPILSRYNLFLGLPAYLDVAFNIILICGLGYGLQKITKRILGS